MPLQFACVSARLRQLAAGAALALSLAVSGCGQILSDDFSAGITEKEWSSGEVKDLIQKAASHKKFQTALQGDFADLSPGEMTLVGLAYRFAWGVDQNWEKALGLLGQACNAGQNRACAYTAEYFIMSEGSAADYGLGLLERICAEGTMTGCYMLTWQYSTGKFLPKNPSNALKYAAASCADPSELSCPYAAKQIVDFDLDQSRAYLEASCEADVQRACYNLADGYQDQIYGTETKERTLQRFEAACGKGFPGACNQVVWYHNQGIAEPQDVESAVKVIARGCEEDRWASACAQVADYYSAYTDYLLHEPELFLRYSTSACAFGEVMMCDWVINAYDHRLAGRDDLRKQLLADLRQLCKMGRRGTCEKVAEIEIASRTYQPSEDDKRQDIDDRACRLGDGEACRRAGWDYALGEKGRQQDVEQAALLFMIGCENGYGPACVDRGSLYEYALHGMEKDVAEATLMYQRACELKQPFACDQYEQARQSMN
ncbi:hypothetical protein WNY37_13745 [Henriciella sp. AS95]|uniref:tetratricopeptide repeat protein n=1 Tax=Henriciella sp. AS95 TaxID=3135782 RepID=UPI00317FF36E